MTEAHPQTSAAAGPAPPQARVGRDTQSTPARPHPARRWLLRRGICAMLWTCRAAQSMFAALVPRRALRERVRVLATGKFHSDTWVTSFLKPMAASAQCDGVWAVAAYPVRDVPGVRVSYPPRWLRAVFGQAGARLLMFAWLALRLRPDFVVGFHLLFNGLAAGVLARLVGARSIYVAVGGPMEILDGGLWSENALFARLGAPDAAIEARLAQAVGRMDRVATMGTKAVEYYRRRGLTNPFHVIPGAIDETRFSPAAQPTQTDIILVGRLVEIKRVDVLLEAIALASKRLPALSARIVGDGPLRAALQQQARELGLEERVEFTGQQSNVEEWYQRARVFALTSDSEGLSLAMMEAMSCGLAPVVSDVGDLGDMIEDGVSGFLAPRRRPDVFADRFVTLLGDETRLSAMSRAARQAAGRVALAPSTRRWESLWRDESPASVQRAQA